MACISEIFPSVLIYAYAFLCGYTMTQKPLIRISIKNMYISVFSISMAMGVHGNGNGSGGVMAFMG